MLTRRDFITLTSGAGAALLFERLALLAQQPLITRAIPSTGERLPIVGLGSSATFAQVARAADVSALRDVFKTLVDGGGRVFDTAPGYGASEEVAGRIAAELGLTERIFWATKVNVAFGRGGGGKADPAAARRQIDQSFARIKKTPIDLIQVHNLGDVPTQLGILKELKAQGRIRYIGVTTTFDQQYDELVDIMRREPLDFIGVDYAIDAREVEQTILPLAQERRIAVLAYQPFGRTRLWARVGSRPVPDYAKEFDAATWAQFFIKFVASHPAVTVVTPATSQAKNMADNLGAARGRLPDQAMRQRMIATIDALPSTG
ncbi:MAG TPA: aldo/keto reductase [Vicinamibacterales bacterium]|nr:aldo/keto reductase [Vicinamibacterales bacterium]